MRGLARRASGHRQREAVCHAPLRRASGELPQRTTWVGLRHAIIERGRSWWGEVKPESGSVASGIPLALFPTPGVPFGHLPGSHLQETVSASIFVVFAPTPLRVVGDARVLRATSPIVCIADFLVTVHRLFSQGLAHSNLGLDHSKRGMARCQPSEWLPLCRGLRKPATGPDNRIKRHCPP